MHDQSHIRDKRQTKERRIEGSNSIIVLDKILIQYAPEKNSSLTGKNYKLYVPFLESQSQIIYFIGV